jgi:hypothetical protein
MWQYFKVLMQAMPRFKEIINFIIHRIFMEFTYIKKYIKFKMNFCTLSYNSITNDYRNSVECEYFTENVNI